MAGKQLAPWGCGRSKRNWRYKNARKISKPRLLAGLHALRNADDRLKGGGAEQRTVMEFLVAQLTGEEAKAARG